MQTLHENNKVLLKALLRDGGHSSLNKVISIDAAILWGWWTGAGLSLNSH